MTEINVSGTTNLDVTPESEQLTVGNFSTDPNKVEAESDSGEGYDNISIPGELLGEEPQEQSTQEASTEQAETTVSEGKAETGTTDEQTSNEQTEQTDTVSDVQDDHRDLGDDDLVFETEDGSKYSMDDVETWYDDSINRHDWQRSNTEKAQELSEQRKAVQPFVEFVETLKKAGDFSETLHEAIEDELGKDAGQQFKLTLQADNTDLPNPYDAENKALQGELDDINAQISLNESMAELKNNYGLDDDKAQKVLDHAVHISETTGRFLALDEAYKVMKFDEPEPTKDQQRVKPSVPVNIQKNVGVKSDKKGKVTSYDDIDVASFFNT